MNKKIFVVGASHANRIYHELLNLQLEGYEIINCTRPGANLEQIPFPDPNLVKENDLVLIQ